MALLTASAGIGAEAKELRYLDLERRLAEEPEPVVSAHFREERGRRLRRWLRGNRYEVEETVRKLHEYARWWQSYGMDAFGDEDELDERGLMFHCGEDLQGKPTLIARPCVHLPKTREESVRAARRCVFTMQRCIDRMTSGTESIVLIFDAAGLSTKNLDLVFARELIAVFSVCFPERLHQVIAINSHWTTNFFWTAISALLDPGVKAKIRFVDSSSLADGLGGVVSHTHPYLRYALPVKARPSDQVPLPASTSRCARGLAPLRLPAGALDSLKAWHAGSKDDWSRQSTAPSETDCRSPGSLSSGSESEETTSWYSVFEEEEDSPPADAKPGRAAAKWWRSWAIAFHCIARQPDEDIDTRGPCGLWSTWP